MIVSLISLLLATAPGVFRLGASSGTPAQPAEPFAVHVFTAARGDPKVVKRLKRAAEALTKELGKRNDWFRVVDEKTDAEILVEVQGYWIDEQWHPESRRHFSEDHYVQAKVMLFDQEFGLKGVDNRSPGKMKDAVSDLARALQEICEDNYGYLLRVRGER